MGYVIDVYQNVIPAEKKSHLLRFVCELFPLHYLRPHRTSQPSPSPVAQTRRYLTMTR